MQIRARGLHLALTAASAAWIAACGGSAPTEPLFSSDESALAQPNTVSENGMSTNGMSTNGMSTNGLSTNGMSTNGLTTNGLAAKSFSTWFAADPVLSAMVMKYVVRCALPAGKTLSYTYSGLTLTWSGLLGLAPAWSSGQPIQVGEQQLVSACLAAHANKFGVHVELSVRGYFSDGTAVPITDAEQATYVYNEGCFFGNLFDGTGVFSAWSSSSPLATRGTTSLRACAISDGQPGQCAPMVDTLKTCEQLCTSPSADAQDQFELGSCTWNGRSYKPISTRLADANLNHCGNGKCEAGESCYSLSQGTGCRDCGVCR